MTTFLFFLRFSSVPTHAITIFTLVHKASTMYFKNKGSECGIHQDRGKDTARIQNGHPTPLEGKASLMEHSSIYLRSIQGHDPQAATTLFPFLTLFKPTPRHVSCLAAHEGRDYRRGVGDLVTCMSLLSCLHYPFPEPLEWEMKQSSLPRKPGGTL